MTHCSAQGVEGGRDPPTQVHYASKTSQYIRNERQIWSTTRQLSWESRVVMVTSGRL